MIDDLDKTLQAFLQPVCASAPTGPPEISFANPGTGFPSEETALPLINLFLCGITQRDDMRENASTVQRQADGTAQVQRPPVFLSATYLITVWTDEKTDVNASQEHGIIGTLTAALLGTPLLPAEVFMGALSGLSAGAVTGKLSNASPARAASVYQALGNRQKLSLDYEVTFPVPVFAPQGTPLVTGRTVRFRSITEQPSSPETPRA
ncbi:Pvc16 family protein [Terriglobus albidus]|uniref:Pvc16 family protein n=1 Tax=Terriglobus albidus TaxID=1592106 RepID=UPI00164DFCE1|nr:Pvc16 family protein [Terriglobus albidus]